MHHGCEAGPAELRSIRLAGETGTADQKIPSDGGDGLPGPRHEGELNLLCCGRENVIHKMHARSGVYINWAMASTGAPLDLIRKTTVHITEIYMYKQTFHPD